MHCKNVRENIFDHYDNNYKNILYNNFEVWDGQYFELEYETATVSFADSKIQSGCHDSHCWTIIMGIVAKVYPYMDKGHTNLR